MFTHLVKISSIVLMIIFICSSNRITAYQDDNKTVLITGANRGIGLALADKFNQQGYHVIATARKPQNTDELNKLGIQVEQLDITDQKSVDALKNKLKDQPIDILLNNAGIMGHGTRSFKDLKIDRLMRIFEVNSLGALKVTQALLENLEKGSSKIIASISSRMGSIKNNNNGAVMGYRASKSALNSIRVATFVGSYR